MFDVVRKGLGIRIGPRSVSFGEGVVGTCAGVIATGVERTLSLSDAVF